MELSRSNPFHIWCDDADSIRTDMVGSLKDFLSIVVYWLFIGTVTILFVFFMLGMAIIDLLTAMFERLTRSKKDD
jgi:hypothetical protein